MKPVTWYKPVELRWFFCYQKCKNIRMMRPVSVIRSPGVHAKLISYYEGIWRIAHQNVRGKVLRS